MKKITLWFLCLYIGTTMSFGQTFTGGTGAIPDNTCDVTNEFPVTVSGIGVLGGSLVLDEVAINITHTFNSDLDIFLIAPDLTEIELSTDNGSSGDNYTDTRFRMDATNSIVGSSAPHAGNFIPEGIFSDADGNNADGTWILRVCDDAGGDIGTVDSWSLTFAAPPSCIEATFSLADGGNICPTDGGFIVDVDVTALGTSSTINILQDGVVLYSGVDGTASPYSIGGLTSATEYNITVEDAADDTCASTQVFTTGVCPPPAPANDDCSGAITITCDNQYTGDTTSATPEDPEPGFCGTSAGTAGAVWYTFTGANSNDAGAAAGGLGDDVTLDLALSTYDTKIRVFTGVCEDLTCVGGNDDFGGNATSQFTLTTTVGTEYFVLVHGFSGNSGAYTLDVTCVAPPTCTAPTIDSSDIVEDCNLDGTGTFTVDIVVSDAGDAGSVFDDGTNTFPVVAGTVMVGPYNSGNSVTIELIAMDEDCSSTVGTFSFTCPQPIPDNDLCIDAEAVVCGDTVSGTNVSATDGDGVAGDGCGTSSTAVGVWYVYSGTGDTVTASTCSQADFDTEITVYTGVCGDFTCLANNDDNTGAGCTGNTSLLEFETVVGTNYYIYVSGFGAATGNFDLSITCVAPPTCTPAVIDSTSVVDTCNPDGTGTFTVDIVVSDAGDAGSVFDDGTNTYSVVAGTVTIGPYNSGESVTIELISLDEDCSSTVGTFGFICPPAAPENDDVAGAINLPVGSIICETEVFGTNAGATDSDEGTNTASCSSSDPNSDVWFKVMVPATGDLTIQTSAADANSLTDTIIIVYSGTAGNLVELDCNDDSNGLFSTIELTALNPGDVLLVRVWSFSTTLKGNFDICAWSPTTLGVEDNTFNGFTYYPNPVKNVLTLESPNTIDKIEVFNVLGQRIVTIDSQNTIQNIDMSNVQAGAYFVKVSIGNQIKTLRVIKE